jgi:hypothetical protein
MPEKRRALMKTVSSIFLILFCFSLSSCETLNEIQKGQLAQTVGSFQLNPVQPNCYWYDGKSYEYNLYQIKITSEPCQAHIIWNGKFIGDTPLNYSFTGTLDRDERVTVRAMPFDEKYASQEGSLKIREELPRQINFKLLAK